MGWSKGQFVKQAFEEIGLASYVFDLQPAQLESARCKLDSMMASWNAKGVRLGYPIPSSPDEGDLDEQTSVPDAAIEAIYTNLAVRLAPSFGKSASPDLKVVAKMSYDTLLARTAVPPEQQMPASMPSGAGNKPWRNDSEFLSLPSDPVLVGQDGLLEFN